MLSPKLLYDCNGMMIKLIFILEYNVLKVHLFKELNVLISYLQQLLYLQDLSSPLIILNFCSLTIILAFSPAPLIKLHHYISIYWKQNAYLLLPTTLYCCIQQANTSLVFGRLSSFSNDQKLLFSIFRVKMKKFCT
jgi:hypothetical protein